MKKALILILAMSVTLPVFAKQKSRAEKQLGVQLGTDFEFNPLTVNGRYQSPSEGLVVIENEKLIGDILDYRTHFKDRIKFTANNEVSK